jgi:FkbM family methyltransferase
MPRDSERNREVILASFVAACSLTKGVRSFRKEHLWKIKVGFRRPLKAASAFLSLAGYRLFRRTVEVQAETFWGGKMQVVLPEQVSLGIFLLGFWEEGLTRMLLEHVREGDVFFDVGAHFGYFTLLGSVLVRQSGRVHSFEPTPSTYQLLCKNAATKTNVLASNLALYSESTDLPFNDYGPVWSAFNSLARGKLDRETLEEIPVRTICVKALSLDDYVAHRRIEKVDFVKIDAESAEFEILRGMKRVMEVMRPMISIEVGDTDALGDKGSRELVTYLCERGYEPYEYEGGNLARHHLRDHYGYDNLLFIPK